MLYIYRTAGGTTARHSWSYLVSSAGRTFLVLDLLILYFLWYERISSVATYFLPSLSAYNNDMRSCLQMSPTTRRARRQAFYCMVSL